MVVLSCVTNEIAGFSRFVKIEALYEIQGRVYLSMIPNSTFPPILDLTQF
jgi:hypothetical protein